MGCSLMTSSFPYFISKLLFPPGIFQIIVSYIPIHRQNHPSLVLPPPAPFPSSEWMVVVDVWNMTKPETGPGLGPKPERQGHRQLPKPKMSMDPKGSNQPQASGQFSYLKTRSGRGPKP